MILQNRSIDDILAYSQNRDLFYQQIDLAFNVLQQARANDVVPKWDWGPQASAKTIHLLFRDVQTNDASSIVYKLSQLIW